MAKKVVVKRSKLGKPYICVGDWSLENASPRRLAHAIKFIKASIAARGKSYEEGIEIRRKLASGKITEIPKEEEIKEIVLTPAQLFELKLKCLKYGIDFEELLQRYIIYVQTEEKVMPVEKYRKEITKAITVR